MSLLLEFDEFRGLTHNQFMNELDRILLISINKLRDSMDLRQRVMLYPIFEKVIQYRKVELFNTDERMDDYDERAEETY